MVKVFLAIYRLEGLVETICVSSMLRKVLSICGESEGITNLSLRFSRIYKEGSYLDYGETRITALD